MISPDGPVARYEAVGGDAHITIPVGEDTDVMKSVLHERPDEEAEAIPRYCRRAMPAHAKLLIIKRLFHKRIGPSDARVRENLLGDLNLNIHAGCRRAASRERTEAEYCALLVKAGLRLTRVIRAPRTSAIIEAEPD